MGNADEVVRVYKFLRDGMYAQYQGLNLLMSNLMCKYYECNRDIKSEEFKRFQKEQMNNRNKVFDNIEFAIGCDSKSAITQKVKQDFSISLKNGLAKGERNITNYKRDFPLMIRGRDLVFTQDLYAKERREFDANQDVYVKWVNKIVFKVIVRNGKKTQELLSVLSKIFDGTYKIQGSSIQINGGNIILNLSISIPLEICELNENTVVGVDLGIAIPAACGLNNSKYEKIFIGCKEDLLDRRTQYQYQRKILQKRLELTRGGRGRNKKLKRLETLGNSESNYVQTYLHMISKRVVDFAVKNNAKYINLEDLSGFSSSKNEDEAGFIMRNWSYYKLQKYIKYKANKRGIIVRKINPYRTSQICSECGHFEQGQRIDQSHFKCKACGFTANADFNASRNIAKSTDFVIEKNVSIA